MVGKRIGFTLCGFLLLSGCHGVSVMSKTEQASYRVVESHGNIELRDYPAMIVAETEVAGERKQAIQVGFRAIAGYIFGGNQSSEKIAMTAPVLQGVTGDHWKVRFVMPSGKNLTNLPKPDDPRVKLLDLPAGRFAVIRFSGTAGDETLEKNAGQLLSFIRSKPLNPIGLPVYAFYNPPWTLPFLRRNEVMMEVVE
jgi:DNA gyrase inhibitor GyrI